MTRHGSPTPPPSSPATAPADDGASRHGLLVLTRREEDEIIMRTDGIELGRIIITRILGDRVRIGLRLPPDIDVSRIDAGEPGSLLQMKGAC